MIDALSAVTPSAPAASDMAASDMAVSAINTNTPTKVEGAAKQFEALMIAQMLRTARENTDDQDSSTSTMLDVADQQFSQVLSNNGGFGLAKLIVKGLNQGQQNANQQQPATE